MPIELTMPALSPTMEKGTLPKWLVGVGDAVEPGEAAALVEAVHLAPPPSAIVTKPACAETSEARAPVTEAAVKIDPRSNATPLARRIAGALGIDLASIRGSGANDHIVRADLGLKSRAVGTPVASTEPAASTSAIYGPPTCVPHQVIKLNGMRRTIARRLTESKQTVPHFYLGAHCNIDALLRLRGELNASLSARSIKLSMNDVMIKAMAIAMVREPHVNVQFAGDEMFVFDRVDIAMAVAIDGGLITPVIRDVGALSLAAIADQSKRLAGHAREGKLLPEDDHGGTASISNLGMFGIDEMFLRSMVPPQPASWLRFAT